MSSFRELGVGDRVLKAIEEIGFETPTPVQQQAIPLLLQNQQDFLGLAQTGTGKTAAFGLPLLELLDENLHSVQALVLAPTRELCVQISKDFESFSKFMNFKIAAVYGGASMEKQIREIKGGAQIITATPGRLIDLIERKVINLKSIRFVVLDEADEMLNMGFQDDIEEILSHTPGEKRVWLFSATMPVEIRRIADRYMQNPHELTIGRRNEAAQNIEHHYYIVNERDRYAALKRILDAAPEIFAIVFARTKHDAQKIAENLIKDGYNADSLHGDLSQQQRDKVMSRFRSRLLQILVATDVAARGIDVDDVTHVIQYHLPDEAESYAHRSGRTARAGKSGISAVLVNRQEMGKIRQIEKKINAKFHLSKVPGAVEVCEQQLMKLIKKIKDVKVNEAGIAKYLPSVMDELAMLEKEELITRMVSIEFNRFLDYYRHAPDLNVDIAHSDKAGAGKNYADGAKVFINLGSMDGFNDSSMRKYAEEVSGIKADEISHVIIKGVYSFLHIPVQKLPLFIESFTGEVYKGRKVRVDSGNAPSGAGGGRGRREGGGNKGRSFRQDDRPFRSSRQDDRPFRSSKPGKKEKMKRW
ncbi:MAG: DEAD/DEAH box helicase [Bacteroidia bacterium]|nr:DEAD/DEAH box helicase [Bacteroidia bacterium]